MCRYFQPVPRRTVHVAQPPGTDNFFLRSQEQRLQALNVCTNAVYRIGTTTAPATGNPLVDPLFIRLS
jgi:hypothetical protein